ncbi:hypothetical protein BH23BAC3_BH23BAC3_25220 [soil metagenome]
MEKLVVLLIVFLFPLLAYSQKSFDPGYTDHSKWDLVWADEFNYTGHPDPAKWGYEEGYWRRVSELQYYTVNRLENARVDGEHLIIEARKETPESFYPTSINDKWHLYTSASVNTRNTAAWTYGRFEIRAKLPKGLGMWPAIWFLSPLRTPWLQDQPWDIPEPHRGAGNGEPHSGRLI